jgi:hypothetical protein
LNNINSKESQEGVLIGTHPNKAWIEEDKGVTSRGRAVDVRVYSTGYH